MELVLLGDVMLGRLVNEALRYELPTYPWGSTLPILAGADVRICNLECVMSDRGAPWSATPKVFHFRTDGRNVAVLKAAGIDAVSLANNHTLDFGYDALLEMLGVLDQAGIHHAGAGSNLSSAVRPAIVEAGGKAIGLIAFTDNEPDWAATSEQPGVFHVPIDLQDEGAEVLLEVVRQTRLQVDYLVTSAHWGPNWGTTPPAEHIPFAHALIDAGTDIVFGHSGHVFRGIEVYRGRPVLYCAGDFVDDYAVDQTEHNDQSFIFVLDIGSGSSRLRLYPTLIEDFQARLARGPLAEQIASTMQALCAALQTPTAWHAQDGYLEISLS